MLCSAAPSWSASWMRCSQKHLLPELATLSTWLFTGQLPFQKCRPQICHATASEEQATCRASRGELSGDMAKATGTLVLSILVKDHVGTFVILNFVISMYALCAVLTKVRMLASSLSSLLQIWTAQAQKPNGSLGCRQCSWGPCQQSRRASSQSAC